MTLLLLTTNINPFNVYVTINERSDKPSKGYVVVVNNKADSNERSREDDPKSEHHLSKRHVTCDLSWLAEHSTILRGPPGPQGLPGNNGIPGIPGTPGTSPGIGCPNSRNLDIDTGPVSGDSSASHVNETTGSVYVRWGRSTCEDTAELVYEGVIGGAHYTHKGSGSNYQCLPLNPIYDDVESGTGEWRALMYGTEYEVDSFSPLSALHDHDAVCAVCRVRSRGTVLMVPARNECPSTEWTREYYGYLMSDYYDQTNKEFICVDRNPEGRDGSSADLNGALLYPVEGRCGSLPCGPYIDGNELTCAVCTI
uniref:Uncharacterized protein LOC100375184 n=1 Tax=Saccoglossus kowalevskii TaxID=10224 RepID=A0ABM0GUU9_SACKO|nr:PREDICTED: uncharacterized protein LOC100375184 [Saccoglossus kowalevskii]